MFPEMFGYVFCCIPEEEQKALRNPNADPAFVRRAQENLTREKHGYRCSKCGRYFPDVQLFFRDAAEDARPYAKLPCKASKCKKAADVFCTSHYYAKNSNALLKFEVDAEHNARQTDSIPIRRDVCHIITSPDEKYIATETFSGTIDIIDTQMKLPVAHRQRTGTNGAFLFTAEHKLLYFIKDAIRCWDFIRNQDTIIFQIPELWKRDAQHRDSFTFVCTGIIYNRNEDTYQYVLATRMKTYFVAMRDGQYSQVVQLPRMPAFGHLTFSEAVNQYTFSTGDDVIIYNSAFLEVERFTPPQIIKLHGGDKLPITRRTSVPYPCRTFISPDGKWLLLDYTLAMLLMTREGREVRFCLTSQGGELRRMGFLDSEHFWYTRGDTTYIQPIVT